MAKNILVTGSGGLIGSETVNFYCKNGDNVYGIDNNMRAYFFGAEGSTKESVKKHSEIYKNYHHNEIDIRDVDKIEELFKTTKFDLIVHTAAQPSHDWAAKEPMTDFSVNANGTLNLLENYRKYSPEGVFIFTSTNKVYGDGPNTLPLIEKKTRYEINPSHKYKNGITEDFPLDNSTHSLFGVSKAAADLMVQEYGRYFNLRTGIFRGGCLTGSGHAGVEQHGFLSYLVKCILTGRKYMIYGYKGKQVRDNIHAHDLISAFDHFYKNPKMGEVYNIGGSRFANISILEAIEKIEKISGRTAKVQYFDKNRIGDHIWYISSVEKFKKHYPDWKYEYDIDATIEDICRNSAFAKKIFSFSMVKNLDYWREKNWYYHNQLQSIFKEFVPENSKVLQIGYGLGDILSSLYPKKAVSVDSDDALSIISKRRYPNIKFISTDPSKINIKEKFDYIIFPNSFNLFEDVQTVLEKTEKLLNKNSRLVVTSVNPRWEPIFSLLEKLKLKRVEPPRNWLRIENLANLLEVSGFEVEKIGFRTIIPTHIPILSNVINSWAKKNQFLSRFCVEQFAISKKRNIRYKNTFSTSIVIPVFNQEQFVKECISLIPKIGKKTEIIFIDDASTDKTSSVIKFLMKKQKNLKLITNKSKQGKSYAIKKGINAASGDIIITYDVNMLINPLELTRFYDLLSAGQADFINASRLIYPTKGQKMRQVNIIGNIIFSTYFSWLLNQRLTDLLSTTKAFFKKDFQKMISEKNEISEIDLLGFAAKNTLKILELPVHFDISKDNKNSQALQSIFYLLKMSLLGLWKLKIERKVNIDETSNKYLKPGISKA